jgi:type I restriction enzyme, S subunit
MLVEQITIREGYKVTDLGEIPVDWAIVELNQIANRITRKNKGTISDNVLTISAQHGLVSQTDFFNKKVASKNLEGYYLLEKNDFAYNKSYSNGYPMGAIKRLELYNFGVVSSLYICFKFDETLINVDFIKQYFNTNLWHEEVAQIAQEGARNHGLLNVSVKEFFNIRIIFPSLIEQQKIAEILSTVDEQIQNTDELIKKTKELKKGLMLQLLTKGIGHTKFKETELGEIPVEWEVRPLNEITRKVTIGLVTTMTKYYVENGVPLIRNSDIKENKFLKNQMVSLDEKFDEKHSQKRLKLGDVITVHTGDIGKSAVIESDLVGAQGFATLNTTPDSEIIDSYYLSWFFNSSVSLNQVYNFSTGDGRNNLNLKDFVNLKIIVPNSRTEQNKIVKILSTLNEQIESYEQEKGKYTEIKKGMMQQLLTGKVRVKI